MLVPKKIRQVSAEQYLKEATANQLNVKKVRFVPERIGGKGFGHFEITYKTPVLVAK